MGDKRRRRASNLAMIDGDRAALARRLRGFEARRIADRKRQGRIMSISHGEKPSMPVDILSLQATAKSTRNKVSGKPGPKRSGDSLRWTVCGEPNEPLRDLIASMDLR